MFRCLIVVVVAVRAERVAVDSQGSQAEAIRMSERGGCVDLLPDCAERAGSRLELCAADPGVMLTQCAKTCETCSYRKLIDEAMACEDTVPECEGWAKVGECEKNPKFMLSGCTTSCGSCEGKKTGCRRANSTSPMAVPGGMNAMFERALRDFPQYSPTALSTDPYVLQFEDMVTPEEAAAIVAAGANNGKGFERSLAGDQLSPVRTSSQVWCDETGGCMQEAAVRNLTARMLEVTQLPYENAEYVWAREPRRGRARAR